MLLVTSCDNTYKCELNYNLVYPDTTYVRTYVFDGDMDARYYISNSGSGGKTLYIYPRGGLGYTIARVPNSNGDIVITDFKTFRYGVDIPYPEK